jgi:hypothetical protein
MSNDTANPRRPPTPAKQRSKTERARRLELVTDRWLAELTRGQVVPLRANRVRDARGQAPIEGRNRAFRSEPPSGA